MIKSAIVSGYATADYVARVPQALQGPGTRQAAALGGQRWPSVGGAALYASMRLAEAGHDVTPLTIVGNDGNGALFVDACSTAKVNTRGIVRTSEVRTPWCLLLYHDDGNCTCLIDHGGVNEYPPTRQQIQLVSSADLVCIAAGAVNASEQVLAAAADSACVAWIAKDDPQCFPAALTRQLARRADIIFCNSAERAMVDAARWEASRAGQLIVETRGARGVIVDGPTRIDVRSEPLQVADTTGAGDTLAGEVLAALLSGADIEAAARRGIDASRALLSSRL